MKGKTSLLVLLTSFILYIMDIISDIYVAIQYYKNGEIWWCAITLVFVIVPHIIINTYAAYININFLWMSARKSFLMWILQISILASFKQEFTRWKREHWKGNTRDAALFTIALCWWSFSHILIQLCSIDFQVLFIRFKK